MSRRWAGTVAAAGEDGDAALADLDRALGMDPDYAWARA
ncbi:hypothetical protein EDD98_5862 [Streptomyces sp. PanSC19]|nr:hypothetical protein EDD98_5862 [Streptomyces sp. PanSC19]